jgi:hypothetical protein
MAQKEVDGGKICNPGSELKLENSGRSESPAVGTQIYPRKKYRIPL